MTSNEELPELISIAEAVSDGAGLDWTAASSHTAEPATVAHLRTIDAIARTHREIFAAELERDPPSPADGAASPEAPTTWGPLVLRDSIGAGGFGDVHRAYDPTLQREVALKLFTPSADRASRLLDEARRLARVRHPNVVVIHGADEHDGRAGLWTELLSGRTLAEWLADRGPLGALEAAVVGMDLCRALSAIHAAGLVYRDVKPENVVREDGGRIVLLDFGAVDAPSSTPFERAELGTPRTMAPEQLRGGPVDVRADVYGLGGLLYRMVSGHHPIEARTLSELVARHESGAIVPLRERRPDLPSAFVQVVEKALAPLPEERYASAAEMERALAAVAMTSRESNHGSHDAPLESAPHGSTAAAPRRALIAMFAITLALAVVVVVALRNGMHAPARESSSPALASRSSPAITHAPGFGSNTKEPVAATASLFLDRPSGPVPVRTGDRVAPGDALFLRFRSNDSLYVYVLDADGRGALFALFPIAGAMPANPLAGGADQRLPGAISEIPFDWQVTSAGGTEELCVLASRAPIAILESELAAVPHPRPGAPVSYARLSPKASDSFRGMGGLVQAGDSGSRSRSLRHLVERVRSEVDAKDLWSWYVRLTSRPSEGR